MNLPLDKLTQLLPPLGKDYWGTLDATKLQAYAACPRKYFYEYSMGWRSDRPSNHLIFGQAWHSALEQLYTEGFTLDGYKKGLDAFLTTYRAVWPETTDSWFGGKTPEAASIALMQYIKEYCSDLYDWQILATEIVDQVPLSEHPKDLLTVKLDMIVQDTKTNQILIVEHKTGSSSGPSWANQWHLSLQVGGYIYACNYFYHQELTPCLVDGVFFLKTKRNFQREQVVRSSMSMQNWATTVSSLIARIEVDYRDLAFFAEPQQEILSCFAQNPTACSNYGGCEFFDLCTCMPNPLAHSSNPPTGFTTHWWNPLESSKPLNKGEN